MTTYKTKNIPMHLLYILFYTFVLAATLQMPYPNAIAAENTVSIIPDDATITSVITAKYLADEKIKALKITVKTTNGVVKLTGIVPDSSTMGRIVTIAQNTDGVVRVISELVIRP